MTHGHRIGLALLLGLGCNAPHTIGTMEDGGSSDTCPQRFVQRTVESGDYPGLAQIRDLSGDGRADIVLTNTWLGGLSVLVGAGDGTFTRTPYPVGGYVFSLVTGQFNSGDSLLDVAAAHFGSTVLLGQGAGKLRTGTALPGVPVWIAAGNVSGDSNIDLVTLNRPPSRSVDVVSVLLGNGDGTFTSSLMDYSVGERLRSLQVLDVTGDGNQDILLLSQSTQTVAVLKGLGDGTFIQRGSYPAGDQQATPMSGEPLVTGDVDNDGKPDVLLVNPGSDTVSVLRNTGQETALFAAPVTYKTGRGPAAVAVADVSGDGNLDALVVNQSAGTVSLLLGLGGGTLGSRCDYTVGKAPGAVAVGDLDGDRRPDFVVSNWASGTLSVFLNSAR